MPETVEWLSKLLDRLDSLPTDASSRPYWSQRLASTQSDPEQSFELVVRRTSIAVVELRSQHFFAETLGFQCVDDNGRVPTSIERELEARVGRGDLTEKPDEAWTLDEFCDYVEVHHDLAARPTSGWLHDYGGCGWHPTGFSRASGQAVYRWRINSVLRNSALGLELAEEGEDCGRIVQVLDSRLDPRVHEALAAGVVLDAPEVAHAVALFRGRAADRETKRSAVVALSRVLEAHRGLLKEGLFSKDEGALFQIANEFDVRHSEHRQRKDYNPAFLDWTFYWYLSTIVLVRDLASTQQRTSDPG
jgi:hypothetical protein